MRNRDDVDNRASKRSEENNEGETMLKICEKCNQTSKLHTDKLCRKCYDKARYKETHYSLLASEERKKTYQKEKQNISQLRSKWRKAKRIYSTNPLNKKKIYASRQAEMKRKINSECSICGSKIRLQRHHDNYDKPLEVRIVCHECHKTIHKETKQ